MTLCACGCGGEVAAYKQTRAHLGHIAGQPMRYKRGHRAEIATQQIAALTDLEIAWLAGLLEGEGSFCLARRVVKRKTLPPRIVMQPQVRIGMTDQDVIEKFAAMVGTSVLPLPDQRDGRKTIYVTTVCNRRALLLMQRVYPMMGARRREQIDAATSGATTPKLAAVA